MHKIAEMAQQIGRENNDAEGVDWNRVERGFIPSQYEFDPQSAVPFVRAMRTMEFWRNLQQHDEYDRTNLSVDVATALAGLAYLLEQTRWQGFLGTSWSEVRDNLISAYREAGVRLAV
ncbi:hypothetical protein [Ensifer adhaerens]|uniref:Uncharacterized protein n=1 Tax=Ensifer adhaerens TaxID=106592 RepID=A0A9Q9DED7_ENSAD|nr:hypothetical protein [Ensifer adhaerens]USJ28599.1 hypothetical protein NE863_35660 [Ensifer adhaerens]